MKYYKLIEFRRNTFARNEYIIKAKSTAFKQFYWSRKHFFDYWAGMAIEEWEDGHIVRVIRKELFAHC